MKRNNKNLSLTAMLIGISVAACAPAVVTAQHDLPDPGYEHVASIEGAEVYKFNDTTNGATCYLAQHYSKYSGNTSISIDCVQVNHDVR